MDNKIDHQSIVQEIAWKMIIQAHKDGCSDKDEIKNVIANNRSNAFANRLGVSKQDLIYYTQLSGFNEAVNSYLDIFKPLA